HSSMRRSTRWTKFGLERFVNGFLDLLSVTLITRFRKKPMHLFGTAGILTFLAGFFFAFLIILEKQWAIYQGETYREIVNQPLFFLALTAVVLGVQLFLAGFIAELLVHTGDRTSDYNIDDRVNF
ncbi:MAG: glycosyltransferase, partial [Bacteroidota bacterium]